MTKRKIRLSIFACVAANLLIAPAMAMLPGRESGNVRDCRSRFGYVLFANGCVTGSNYWWGHSYYDTIRGLVNQFIGDVEELIDEGETGLL